MTQHAIDPIKGNDNLHLATTTMYTRLQKHQKKQVDVNYK